MKTKILLTALCLLCGIQTYGQQTEESSLLYKAPPRKEIRHRISTDGSQTETANDMQRASGEYIMNKFPTTGEIRGVVLLVAYKDIKFGLSDDSIRTLLQNRYNADNYTEEIEYRGYSVVDQDSMAIRASIPGSARDYFREQSGGAFTPHFDVIGPITLDKNRKSYGDNRNGSDKDTGGMIKEACQKAYDLELTDFTDYDNDNDGVVDFVYVVYAGSDEAQTGIEECIWAKASTISLKLGNDMKISRYACSGELYVDLEGLTAGIGTFVHEFSHILGLPDFYNTVNTDSEQLSMDVWSVMDYGLYNRGGFVPCAYTAFERYSLGWLPMNTIEGPATLSLGTTAEENTGYRIVVADDTTSFYLVETIRKEGWNRYAYAEGLLISQVTYDAKAWKGNKVNATGGAYRHCIVPASNCWSINEAVGYNPTLHLFGTRNHDFTIISNPPSVTQFGARMNKPLTNISYSKETGKTSLDFCKMDIAGGVEVITTHSTLSTNTYDLQGRPVENPSQGIYIRNGKKVVIK